MQPITKAPKAIIQDYLREMIDPRSKKITQKNSAISLGVVTTGILSVIMLLTSRSMSRKEIIREVVERKMAESSSKIKKRQSSMNDLSQKDLVP